MHQRNPGEDQVKRRWFLFVFRIVRNGAVEYTHCEAQHELGASGMPCGLLFPFSVRALAQTLSIYVSVLVVLPACARVGFDESLEGDSNVDSDSSTISGGDDNSIQDCPPDLHDGGDGSCVPSGECSAGFHLDGCGVCFATGCCAGYIETSPGACERESLPAPTLLTPLDSIGELGSSVVFSWTSVNGAPPVVYDLAVATTPDCASGDVLAENGISATVLDAGTRLSLPTGGSSYWCVRARETLGRTSSWSPARRLVLASMRQRVLATKPAAPCYRQATAPIAMLAGSPLTIPYVSTNWDDVITNNRWRFLPEVERWTLDIPGPGIPPAFLAGAMNLDAVFVDQVRGDVLGFVSSELDTIPSMVELPYVFSPDLTAWTPLTLAAGSSEMPLYCDAVLVAHDVLRDRIQILEYDCWRIDNIWVSYQWSMFELDRTQDPPLLTTINDGFVPPDGRPRAWVYQAASAGFVLIWEDPSLSLTSYFFDPAAGLWSPLPGPTPNTGIVLEHPLVGGNLYVDLETAAAWVWDPAYRGWAAHAFAGAAAMPVMGSRGAAWYPTARALWSAVGVGTGVPMVWPECQAFVIEADDHPSLTLFADTTGSVDGTTTGSVLVSIASDAEAEAWLLEETGVEPAADDARWQSNRPTAYTFAPVTQGLRSLYVWLRYAHGGVNPQPGRASIWVLPQGPVAPQFTLYGLDTNGQVASATETSTTELVAQLESPIDGIIGLIVKISSTEPLPEDFNSFGFPVSKLNISSNTTGTLTAYGWVLDVAGQVSPAGTDDILVVDSRAPVVQLGGDTDDVLISGSTATLSWSATDNTPPITYDLRVSSARTGCAGDIVAVDATTATTYALDTSTLVPQQIISVCVRATDSASSPNTSTFREGLLRYQATPARWFALTPAPTSNGYASAVAYDTSRNLVMVFGGYRPGPMYHNDVYTYDPATDTWAGPLVTTGTKPSGRGGAGALYDEATDRLIVWGGFYYGPVYRLETSALDLNTLVWTRLLDSASSPPGASHFPNYFDSSRRLWVVGSGDVWRESYGMRYVYDIALNTWTELPTITGFGASKGSLLPYGDQGLPVLVSTSALYSLDLDTWTSTLFATIAGASLSSDGSGWDDATGLIVQYLEWSNPVAQQSRRTYVVDVNEGLRFLTDAANMPDRAFFGMLREPTRRSVLLMMGYTQHNDPWVTSALLHEFRINGGPRVFASDPITGNEQSVSGNTVNLSVSWDENAAAWLVNETEWPPPASNDGMWTAVRPTSYTFTDASLGNKTVYVWIKDTSSGETIQDAGRWTIERIN